MYRQGLRGRPGWRTGKHTQTNLGDVDVMSIMAFSHPIQNLLGIQQDTIINITSMSPKSV